MSPRTRTCTVVESSSRCVLGMRSRQIVSIVEAMTARVRSVSIMLGDVIKAGLPLSLLSFDQSSRG
jgi:hypothetical protein